jgi:hypothetical protein
LTPSNFFSIIFGQDGFKLSTPDRVSFVKSFTLRPEPPSLTALYVGLGTSAFAAVLAAIAIRRDFVNSFRPK